MIDYQNAFILLVVVFGCVLLGFIFFIAYLVYRHNKLFAEFIVLENRLINIQKERDNSITII